MIVKNSWKQFRSPFSFSSIRWTTTRHETCHGRLKSNNGTRKIPVWKCYRSWAGSPWFCGEQERRDGKRIWHRWLVLRALSERHCWQYYDRRLHDWTCNLYCPRRFCCSRIPGSQKLWRRLRHRRSWPGRWRWTCAAEKAVWDLSRFDRWRCLRFQARRRSPSARINGLYGLLPHGTHVAVQNGSFILEKKDC